MKIERFYLDDVPVTTYEIEDGKKKPLVYFFHGFTGNRDANIMERGEVLAQKGFFVVAIDAYLHGERQTAYAKGRTNQEKYEDIIDVVMHTAQDAKRLYHKYFKHNPHIANHAYYAYGVSMGSAISFYLATIDPQLKALAALVCFPSFVAYYQTRKAQYKWKEDFIYQRRLAYYELHDPLIHYKRLLHTHLFMAIGEHDEVVPNHFAKALHEKLPESTLKSYDTGHISTPEMLADSYAYLVEKAGL